MNKLSTELCGDYSLVRGPYLRRGSSTSKITIGDEEFINSLISLGIKPGKTFNLDWIDLDSSYIRDFIRGYFDGDGSVYLRNDIPLCNFVGNKIFIPKLRDFLFSIGVFQTMYKVVDRGNFCSIHFGSKKYGHLFYDYIYYDSCFCLQRKRNKFLIAPLACEDQSVPDNIGEVCDDNTEITRSCNRDLAS